MIENSSEQNGPSGIYKIPTESNQKHLLFVRVCHWINAVCFVALVISGIMILYALPELYWGHDGYIGHDRVWLSLPIELDESMSLTGRNYHYLFAWIFVFNGLFYLISLFTRKHFMKKLVPEKDQLSLKYIVHDIVNHLKFKVSHQEQEERYNFLQKITYILIIFVVCPMMLISGLSMSPGFVSIMPELLDFFGGRHSGRSVHFICASILVLFLLVHLFQLILVGFKKEVYAMIFGFHKKTKD